MKQAKVIEPDGRKKNMTLKCLNCDLEYTHRDYKILKDVKKLVYFKIKFGSEETLDPICHYCLRDVFLELNNDKPTKITIISKKEPETHTFYADPKSIERET